jgi:hypothetical protein
LPIWFPTIKSQKLPRFSYMQVACHISLESSQRRHLGIPGQNDIWVLVSWPGTKYTIRGKVVASPKSRSWWVLWICVYPWLVHAPKCCNYTLTNLLFDLCRSIWVIELLINLPSPISKLQHALLPSKCCEPRNVPQFPLLPLSSPLDSQLSPLRSLGVRQWALLLMKDEVGKWSFGW